MLINPELAFVQGRNGDLEIDPENWQSIKKILVILAHPDDPEFFCGGSIARWTQMGHQVAYCLLTRGEKGINRIDYTPDQLLSIRNNEQRLAADELGVGEIIYLDLPDGEIQVTFETKKSVVRVIRHLKPDIVISCDPTNYFHRNNRLNHPDHRAAGLIVMEALFPACGNPLYFPELIEEGYVPHTVKEAWFSLTSSPDTLIDVTETWDKKRQALHYHRSQIPDIDALDRNLLARRSPESTEDNPVYFEGFRRVIF